MAPGFARSHRDGGGLIIFQKYISGTPVLAGVLRILCM